MIKKWSCLSFGLAVFLIFADIAISATATPSSMANIAFYKGEDRQQILEAGAKKEGKLLLYTSGTVGVPPLVAAFEKKYPYIKVEIWRSGADALVPKIMEEYRANKLLCDVIEGTNTTHFMLQKGGISQPFYSPNLAFIQEGAITTGPGGSALAAAFREQSCSLGYNTKLLTKDQVPKSYQDLLNPRWKGKMPIAGSDTGTRVMGTMLVAMGEEFVRQLAKQEIAVHMVGASAITDLVVNGEYALSPTITDVHVISRQQKGAPVDWVPLEPVSVGVGQIALSKNAPHPYAAMLFVDFELSKESAELHKTMGFNSSRKDFPGFKVYKKFYGPRSLDEEEQWKELFNSLFIPVRK